MLSTKVIHIYRHWLVRKSDWVYRLALLPTAPSFVAFIHVVIPKLVKGTDNIPSMSLLDHATMGVFIGVGGGLIYAIYIHLFSLVANLLDYLRQKR